MSGKTNTNRSLTVKETNSIFKGFSGGFMKQKSKGCFISDWHTLSDGTTVYLMHYKLASKGSTIPKNENYGDIRGTLVDFRGTPIFHSYGYTKVSPPVSTVSVDDSNTLTVSHLGIEMTFEDAVISPYIEGIASVRVYKIAGEVFVSTHKRIDTTESKYKSLPSFDSMFYEASGYKKEDLFDPKEDTSSDVYHFLVIHPKLVCSSKRFSQESYCVYLKTDRSEWLEKKGGVSGVLDTDAIPMDDNGSTSPTGVVKLTNFNQQEAQDHILRGYYDRDDYNMADPRVLPGETILVSYGKPQDRRTVRICGHGGYSRYINICNEFDTTRSWIGYLAKWEIFQKELRKSPDFNGWDNPFIIQRDADTVDVILNIPEKLSILWGDSIMVDDEDYRDFNSYSEVEIKRMLFANFILCLPPYKQMVVGDVIDIVAESEEAIREIRIVCDKIPDRYMDTTLVDVCKMLSEGRDFDRNVEAYLAKLTANKKYTIYRKIRRFNELTLDEIALRVRDEVTEPVDDEFEDALDEAEARAKARKVEELAMKDEESDEEFSVPTATEGW